jgi:L-glutamine-phosphate cytidylyltransferase
MNDHRVIILAAGQGTRLRPFTDTVPKCMVLAAGKPLLEWHLDVLESVGLDDIILVAGYKADKIVDVRVKKVINERYDTTNMIQSLFCADTYINGNLIIAYGDIVYSKNVIKKLLHDPRDIVIACDDDWHDYWSQRFEDPLSDAETFEKGSNGRVLSLGKKTTNPEKIQGQYIGLIKLSPKGCDLIKWAYQKAEMSPDEVWSSGRNINQAYMTDLLNHFASEGLLHYVSINRGWIEVDDHSDLEIAKEMLPKLVN